MKRKKGQVDDQEPQEQVDKCDNCIFKVWTGTEFYCPFGGDGCIKSY